MKKSPILLVRTLIIVETLPTYLLCSESDPPVVANRNTLKQYANPISTNLITSATGLLPSALRTVISY